MIAIKKIMFAKNKQAPLNPYILSYYLITLIGAIDTAKLNITAIKKHFNTVLSKFFKAFGLPSSSSNFSNAKLV
jgi:hypothetical protein